MPVSWTRTISSSTMPLGVSMRARRARIRKIALHTIAQVSAICSTIRAAAVRWRRSVDRMGKKCMASSVRLELDRGGDLAAAPGGQEAREHAGDHREPEGRREHGEIELSELGVVSGLVAHGEQAEPCQAQAEHAAGKADRPGLDEELAEDRPPRGAKRATDADLGRPAEELGEQEPDR